MVLAKNPQRRRGKHASRRGKRAKVREYLWPSMGGGAFLRWAVLTFRRQTGHAHKVALGAALGMLFNFVPLPGFGTIVTVGLVWLCRGSIVAALLAQIPGNAWVMPLIWWLNYEVGQLLLPMPVDPNAAGLLAHATNLGFIHDHWPELLHHVVPPLYLGSVVLGVSTALLTYSAVYYEMRRYRARKHAARVALREGQQGRSTDGTR